MEFELCVRKVDFFLKFIKKNINYFYTELKFCAIIIEIANLRENFLFPIKLL